MKNCRIVELEIETSGRLREVLSRALDSSSNGLQRRVSIIGTFRPAEG